MGTKSKTNPMRTQRASRGYGDRSREPSVDEPFPPISISLPHFLKDGSDQEFRQLLYALIKLTTVMVQNRQHLGAYIGMTHPQYTMLALIAENPSISIGKLAEQMNVSSQFVTIEVGKLVMQGIVEKRSNEHDRRSLVLNLTKKGESLLKQVGPLRRRINDLMFRSLTDERARTLKNIVDVLIADGAIALHELKGPLVHGRKVVT